MCFEMVFEPQHVEAARVRERGNFRIKGTGIFV